MTVIRMEVILVIIDMLDSCRVELELLRVECTFFLVYVFRDWKKENICMYWNIVYELNLVYLLL